MFTALVPPPTVLGPLEEFVEPRREADPAVRWLPTDNWHLTTAFMESVPQRHLDRVLAGLAEVAGRTAPLDVTLGGAGCFPDPSRARVLYLAATPADALERLSASCRQAVAHAGVEVDGARFVPHLTLARMRRPVEATRWLRILDEAPTSTWRAGELILIESHLRDMTNRYEVVERFRLTGRVADAV